MTWRPQRKEGIRLSATVGQRLKSRLTRHLSACADTGAKVSRSTRSESHCNGHRAPASVDSAEERGQRGSQRVPLAEVHRSPTRQIEVTVRRNYNRAYLHFAPVTWDPQQLISPRVRGLVYTIILSEYAKQHCRVEAIGGIEDRVHVGVHMSSVASSYSLTKATTGGSSNAATKRFPEVFFKWQGAYGVESVSPKGLAEVIRYVQRHRERHTADRLVERWETIDSDMDEE
ncbi:MAG TPA: transposase [Chthonomonadaceae bacterium]|nr:transposase [Chthonomonadaceae bacterium]